jgi:hypothetical protein
LARAPNDGHTILLVSSNFAINRAIRKGLPYDTLKDFSAVAFVAQSPLVVTAAPKLPASSTRRNRVVGRRQHQPDRRRADTRRRRHQADAPPYRGGAPAINDLIGDHSMIKRAVDNVPPSKSSKFVDT